MLCFQPIRPSPTHLTLWSCSGEFSPSVSAIIGNTEGIKQRSLLLGTSVKLGHKLCCKHCTPAITDMLVTTIEAHGLGEA